jgi:hypothetical protein
MLRTTFPKAKAWHTLIGRPEVKPVEVTIPSGYSYIPTSKTTGDILAVVDVQFLQKELFKRLTKQEGKLVVAVAHNTTYYGDGDATECCSRRTHGVDTATGNSFMLSSYLLAAPSIVENKDVQPLTEQLAEFINDPLHDLLMPGGQNIQVSGNVFPRWLRPASMLPGDQGACGGAGGASAYVLLEPTDTNPKNNVPASRAFVARVQGSTYHLQNVALPSYTGASEDLGTTYSFSDPQVHTDPAQPCPARGGPKGAGGGRAALPEPTVAPISPSGPPNGHRLIGYWIGYGPAGSTLPLREISPQWDVIIVAFATPDHTAREGTLRFSTPASMPRSSGQTLPISRARAKR